MARCDNYPDDIRQYDDDPRSPFYAGDDFDAKNDAWEQVWNDLRQSFTAEMIRLGYHAPDSLDVIEKAAADLTDLYVEDRA